MLPGADGLVDHDRALFLARVLLHHHGIRTLRHSCACEDSHALAAGHRARKRKARAAFAYKLQLGPWRAHVRRAHSIAIPDGTIERRIVAISEDVFSENPPH